MFAYLTAASLFVLSALRLLLRLRQEAKRQQMLSWPRVPARMVADEVEIRLRYGHPVHLAHGYAFFANGRRYTGSRVASALYAADREEQQQLREYLNARREGLRVTYNPTNPTENFLFVAHSGLRWWNVLVYIFFGVLLPILVLSF